MKKEFQLPNYKTEKQVVKARLSRWACSFDRIAIFTAPDPFSQPRPHLQWRVKILLRLLLR